MSIQLRRAANKVYYVHWHDGRSQRISTKTTDLAEAKKFLAAWSSDAPKTGRQMTIGEIWGLYWSKHVERNVASPETLGYRWQRLQSTFARLKPAQIDHDCIDTYETRRLMDGVSSATIRRELAALASCLNWAKERHYVRADDIHPIELPAAGAPKQRWLQPEEVAALLTTAADEGDADMLLFIWLAWQTGARKTALVSLTWDRVDFESRTIDLQDPNKPETKKVCPVVPISDALLPVLKAAYRNRRQIKSNLVLGGFTDVWRSLKQLADRAGVADVSPHVFRHTAATEMARNGVDPWAACNALGLTLQTYTGTYAKKVNSHLLTAVNSISGRVSAA